MVSVANTRALIAMRVVLVVVVCVSAFGVVFAKMTCGIEPSRALSAHIERPSAETEAAVERAFVQERHRRHAGMSFFQNIFFASLAGASVITVVLRTNHLTRRCS